MDEFVDVNGECHLFAFLLIHTAFFIFLAASAGAGVISAYFWFC
jgi:hypothetical protein